MRDENLEKILNYDAVAEAEKVTGKKHWSNFNRDDTLTMLKMQSARSEIVKQKMISRSDTYLGMSWEYLCNILKSRGFEVATSWEIKRKTVNYTEEACLWYKPGILIYTDSYSNKSTVNSGQCYYELQMKEELLNSEESNEEMFRLIHSGGCHDKQKKKIHNKLDIREGLFYELEKAETIGNFVPVWEYPDICFWIHDFEERSNIHTTVLNHTETCKLYEELTRSHISKCPQKVQDMIEVRMHVS